MNRILLSRLAAAAAARARTNVPLRAYPSGCNGHTHAIPAFSPASVVRTLTTTPRDNATNSSPPGQSSSSATAPPEHAPPSAEHPSTSSASTESPDVSSAPAYAPTPDLSSSSSVVDASQTTPDVETTSAFSRFFNRSSSSSSSSAPFPTSATESGAAVSDTVGDQVVSQAADVVSSSSTAIASTKSSAFTEALLTPAMTMLNSIHDLTGLPWWLSIAIATVTIRTALLPVTVMTMKNSAKMQALRDDISYRREAVMEAARSGDRKLSAARQAEMQAFMRNAGIAPARVLIGPLVQFPVFISFFVSIRRLAVSDPTFTTGGILWFSDLSAKDPNYILPVLCGLTLVGMTELGGDTGSASATPQMRMFMRAVSVLSVPMTSWFPTAIFCYWIPNNLLSMTLGAAMRRPSTRKALGMAIDPATIVGTRAHRARTLTRQSMSMKESARRMDPAVAAASYNVARPSSATSTVTVKGSDVVKPVLLKSRPKRAKTKKDNATMKQFD